MWTLSERTEKNLTPRGVYATKRELVNAMEAQRQPKTPVYRNGRDYNFQGKDKK